MKYENFEKLIIKLTKNNLFFTRIIMNLPTTYLYVSVHFNKQFQNLLRKLVFLEKIVFNFLSKLTPRHQKQNYLVKLIAFNEILSTYIKYHTLLFFTKNNNIFGIILLKIYYANHVDLDEKERKPNQTSHQHLEHFFYRNTFFIPSNANNNKKVYVGKT